MRFYLSLGALALFSGALFAQSADDILKETKNLPSTPALVFQHKTSIPAASTTAPAIQNVLVVMGDNVDNSGVPCFECVTNGQGNTIGLVAPDTLPHADGVTSYAFDNYMVDNSYTGNCNFTFLVKDAANKYILKLGPFSFAENPGTSSLTSTATVLPKDPAAVGVGSVISVVACGSTTAVSTMPVYINYP